MWLMFLRTAIWREFAVPDEWSLTCWAWHSELSTSNFRRSVSCFLSLPMVAVVPVASQSSLLAAELSSQDFAFGFRHCESSYAAHPASAWWQTTCPLSSSLPTFAFLSASSCIHELESESLHRLPLIYGHCFLLMAVVVAVACSLLFFLSQLSASSIQVQQFLDISSTAVYDRQIRSNWLFCSELLECFRLFSAVMMACLWLCLLTAVALQVSERVLLLWLDLLANLRATTFLGE